MVEEGAAEDGAAEAGSWREEWQGPRHYCCVPILDELKRAILKLDRSKRTVSKQIAKFHALEDLRARGERLEKNQRDMIESKEGKARRWALSRQLEELDEKRNAIILCCSPSIREAFGCCGNCGSVGHKLKRAHGLAVSVCRKKFLKEKTITTTVRTKSTVNRKGRGKGKGNQQKAAATGLQLTRRGSAMEKQSAPAVAPCRTGLQLVLVPRTRLCLRPLRRCGRIFP